MRPVLVASAALVMAACAGTEAPAHDADTRHVPRVFVEAVLFDAAPGAVLAHGAGDVASTSFGDIAVRSGARYVVSPHVLTDAGAVTRMSVSSPVPDAELAGYRLDVTPQLVEAGRIQLDVDLQLRGKSAHAVVVVDDKQLLVLPTEIMLEERRFVLLVRPTIVRGRSDLEAIMSSKTATTSAR